MVLRIRPKFWWMLPMGVRDNHTKFVPETQRWRLGTGVAWHAPHTYPTDYAFESYYHEASLFTGLG